MNTEIKIDLQDTQWQFDYVDYDRNIARAIVYDESGQFYFVRAQRDDEFGKATLKLSYEEAVKEYEHRANTKLGKLIANRELPVLRRAKELIDSCQ